MKAIRQAAFLLALAAVPAVLIGFWLIEPKGLSPAAEATAAGEVDLATAMGWPNVLWVDARSGTQFEQGHIPNAVLLTEERWDEELVRLFDQWDADSRVVVYCDSLACDKSQRVAARLRDEVGLENVHVLKGGWEAWQKRAK